MKILAAVLLLASLPAFGQAYSSSVTQNSPGNYGRPVPFAQVIVCASSDTAVPCTQKVTTFTTDALSVQCTLNAGSGVLTGGPTSGTNCNNPGLADAQGNFTLYLRSGLYRVCTFAQNWLCQEISVGGGAGGSFKAVPNCTAAGTVLNETVQESSQIVNGVSQTCATVGAIGSTSIIGICSGQGTCGNTGVAQVATGNTNQCFFDNTPNQGDYVIPSSTTTGFCSGAGATRPSSPVETLGNVFQANVGGAGTLGTIQVAPLSLLLPGSTGGSGLVQNPGCAGTPNTFYPSGLIASVTGDCLTSDDAAGHMTMKGLGLTDNSTAGFLFQVQGAAPSLSAGNAVYLAAPQTVNSTFGILLPPQAPVTPNCVQWGNPSVTGWVQLQDSGAPCGTGGGISGTTQVTNPSAPTLSTNGTPGVVSDTYLVVGCQDILCVNHTNKSATATIATANATLSNTNSINLSGYGDTIHGARCYNIYRTASGGTPSSTGLIAACVGKKFIDTGLAGDSSTPPGANNTTLYPDTHPLPGCNIELNGVTGPDAPPCTPTAFDDEMQQTFGLPADVNNSVWSWGGGGTSPCSQGSATASWTGGMLILTSDTTTTVNCLVANVALPTTPYTFEVYITDLTVPPNTSGNACQFGFRESSSGKMVLIGPNNAQQVTTTTASGGTLWQIENFTSATAPVNIAFLPYMPPNGYFKLQNNGTNVIGTASDNAVSFSPTVGSIAVASAFSTAPNQLIIAGRGAAGSPAVCGFDFVRRTQ